MSYLGNIKVSIGDYVPYHIERVGVDVDVLIYWSNDGEKVCKVFKNYLNKGIVGYDLTGYLGHLTHLKLTDIERQYWRQFVKLYDI